MSRRAGRGSLAIGMATLVLLMATAVTAPWLAPHDPFEQRLEEDLRPPTATHLLGQDKLGRDQLSRVIYGSRVSLQVGLLTVAISLLLGLAVGSAAGLLGGWVDASLMRLVDILLAFPGILLAIAMSAVMGPSITNVVVALSLIGWTGYARVVRGETLAVRRLDHVRAAEALGAGRLRVLLRHVLPSLLAPVAVQASFGMAAAIVAEASLSFLGLGVQPPQPSWGSMVDQGRGFLLVAPHMTLYPGLAIFVTVLGLNFLGDGLRDYLDVKSR